MHKAIELVRMHPAVQLPGLWRAGDKAAHAQLKLGAAAQCGRLSPSAGHDD